VLNGPNITRTFPSVLNANDLHGKLVKLHSVMTARKIFYYSLVINASIRSRWVRFNGFYNRKWLWTV